MVIKREMSLDSAVFEEEEEEEEEGSVISVCLRTRKKARPRGEKGVLRAHASKCVFSQTAPLPLSPSPLCICYS